jgi:hypothetical protein
LKSSINEIEFLGGLDDLNYEQNELIKKFIYVSIDSNTEQVEKLNKLANNLADELNRNWWEQNKSRFIN